MWHFKPVEKRWTTQYMACVRSVSHLLYHQVSCISTSHVAPALFPVPGCSPRGRLCCPWVLWNTSVSSQIDSLFCKDWLEVVSEIQPFQRLMASPLGIPSHSEKCICSSFLKNFLPVTLSPSQFHLVSASAEK